MTASVWRKQFVLGLCLLAGAGGCGNDSKARATGDRDASADASHDMARDAALDADSPASCAKQGEPGMLPTEGSYACSVGSTDKPGYEDKCRNEADCAALGRVPGVGVLSETAWKSLMSCTAECPDARSCGAIDDCYRDCFVAASHDDGSADLSSDCAGCVANFGLCMNVSCPTCKDAKVDDFADCASCIHEQGCMDLLIHCAGLELQPCLNCD